MKVDTSLSKLLCFMGVVAGLAAAISRSPPTRAASVDSHPDEIPLLGYSRELPPGSDDEQLPLEKLAQLPDDVRGRERPAASARNGFLWSKWPAVEENSYFGTDLVERFRVPAVDGGTEKQRSKYNPAAPNGSRLNPFSVPKNDGPRVNTVPFEHGKTREKENDQPHQPEYWKLFPSLEYPHAGEGTEFTFPRRPTLTKSDGSEVQDASPTHSANSSVTQNSNDSSFRFNSEEHFSFSVPNGFDAKFQFKDLAEGALSHLNPTAAVDTPSKHFKEREELDNNFFRLPKADFFDNALLSIEDYQRELKDLKDIDISNRFDPLPTRDVGPLCGVFQHPFFHAELRAINITSYMLRNVYVSPRIRLRRLTVIFEGPHYTNPKGFTIRLPRRPFLQSKQHVLRAGFDTRQVKKVTIRDSSGNFTVSLDVSRCIVPQFMKISAFKSLSPGVSTGSSVMYTSNFLTISDFSYDGRRCPAAYFWAGRGRNPARGFKIPIENLGLKPLRAFYNENVHVGLPKPYTWYDVDYVAVYCPARRQVLAYRPLPSKLWRRNLLPPASTTLDVAKNLRLF